LRYAAIGFERPSKRRELTEHSVKATLKSAISIGRARTVPRAADSWRDEVLRP